MVGEFVSIGRINLDIDMHVKSLPKLNDHVISDEGQIAFGGSAANFATQTTRLGIKTSLFSCVGDDLYGELCLKEMSKIGVDTSGVLVLENQATGLFIYVHDNQNNQIVVARPGANKFLEKRIIEEESIVEAKVIHIAGSFPMMIETASETANTNGIVFSLDPGRTSKDLDFQEILRRTDLLFVNREELKDYFKIEANEQELRKFAKTFPGIVVVKMGKAGAIATDGFEYCTSGVFEVPVRNTLGAGDAFAAGFITAWTRSEKITQALNVANAVAAMTIKHDGAQNGQPDMDQTAKLLREHNILIDEILKTFKPRGKARSKR